MKKYFILAGVISSLLTVIYIQYLRNDNFALRASLDVMETQRNKAIVARDLCVEQKETVRKADNEALKRQIARADSYDAFIKQLRSRAKGNPVCLQIRTPASNSNGKASKDGQFGLVEIEVEELSERLNACDQTGEDFLNLRSYLKQFERN